MLLKKTVRKDRRSAMKRTVWNITLASLITLLAYIALYAFWGAILSGVENPTLKLFLISLMTTVAFGFFLLYTNKIRGSVRENEVISDYKNKQYVSPVEDLKLILKRESKMLLCLTVIVFACFALNTFDDLIFEKKTISFPTFFFIPTYIFGAWIKIPFVEYVCSIILDCVFYLLFLLIYRQKRYNYWTKQ